MATPQPGAGRGGAIWNGWWVGSILCVCVCVCVCVRACISASSGVHACVRSIHTCKHASIACPPISLSHVPVCYSLGCSLPPPVQLLRGHREPNPPWASHRHSSQGPYGEQDLPSTHRLLVIRGHTVREAYQPRTHGLTGQLVRSG